MGRRDLLDEFDDLPETRALAHQFREALAALQLLAEQFVLPAKENGFPQALDYPAQFGHAERLLNIIISSPADRLDGGIDRAVGRDHNQRYPGMMGLDIIQDVQAAAVLQLQVGHHQVDPLRFQQVKGLIARRCGGNLPLLGLQADLQCLQGIEFIFHNQNMQIAVHVKLLMFFMFPRCVPPGIGES